VRLAPPVGELARRPQGGETESGTQAQLSERASCVSILPPAGRMGQRGLLSAVFAKETRSFLCFFCMTCMLCMICMVLYTLHGLNVLHDLHGLHDSPGKTASCKPCTAEKSCKSCISCSGAGRQKSKAPRFPHREGAGFACVTAGGRKRGRRPAPPGCGSRSRSCTRCRSGSG